MSTYKKIVLTVTAVVIVLLAGSGFFSGVIKPDGLCVGGLNLQTSMDIAHFQTTPPGPAMGIFKDKRQYMFLYPILDFKNVEHVFDISEPIFKARRSGWGVFGPKEQGNSEPQIVAYVVGGPMPFLISSIDTYNGTVAKDMRMFLDTMTLKKCPSPNPGEYTLPPPAGPSEH